MHLSAVMSWLYKTMENRKKVYSKIKFVEKYKNWILKKKNPLKFKKMEKSLKNMMKRGQDDKPR